MPIKRTLAALVLTLPTGSVGEQGHIGREAKRDTKNVPLFLIGIRAEILKYTHVYKLPFVLAKNNNNIGYSFRDNSAKKDIHMCLCLSISVFVCVWECTQV